MWLSLIEIVVCPGQEHVALTDIDCCLSRHEHVALTDIDCCLSGQEHVALTDIDCCLSRTGTCGSH